MKLTLEEHRELGEKVKEFRELLMQPKVMLQGRFKSSRPARAVRAALTKIELMRSELDNVVCADYPDCQDATKIYYGPSKKWQAEQAKLVKGVTV